LVAFVGSFLVALIGMGAILWYGRRRPIGAPLSWGEAMASATLVFALMFWAYGVVPHQWLQWANNELGWTPTKKLWTADQYETIGVPLPPFEINYEKIRDVVVVLIYGFFLGAQIAMFAMWQDRGKRAERKAQRELEPSTYGRPLVKQG
jgi:hypothetical protein